jgi:hypothetical protein
MSEEVKQSIASTLGIDLSRAKKQLPRQMRGSTFGALYSFMLYSRLAHLNPYI